MAIGLRGSQLLKSFAWIAAALALTQATLPISSFGNGILYAVAAERVQKDLAQEIGQRITRVPEFQFIREEAKRMGVKAYLFGGTAAGFAHYVNWDLKREGGDTRFQPDRFDYDYTDIYRSTQDLDIVIDGPAEKAQELQKKLAHTFPHLQGSKTAWEVRLLRSDWLDKQALLNNPEFLNQHTDSNSTGMIEITPPQNGEPVVRDLRDWESKDPYFLRDVREGKLHYYFSPKHVETKFAKEGRNPPILSVIRYLTKAFQYELEIRPEDLAQIKKIIDRFDPNGSELKNDYVRNWLLKKDNGRKLIQNAVNIEYAWNTLEKLGLRSKLIAIEKNPDTEGSLAWWMSKEPLRSLPIGQIGTKGKHPTIRELIAEGALPSDLTVAHETNNFLAYESITRAHTGDPNVLISRAGKTGEAAAHGDGFYTQIGRKGARGTGITIRFSVDPDAREGIDFTRMNGFLIFKNKNALRVIPESLKLSPLQYFQFLANGEGFDSSDRAIFEKLRRKIVNSSSSLSDEEYLQIRSIIANRVQQGEFHKELLSEWASLPRSARFSKGLFDPLLKTGHYDILLSDAVFSKPSFSGQPEFSSINEKARRLREEFKTLPGNGYPSKLSALIQTDKKKAMQLMPLFMDAGTSASLSALDRAYVLNMIGKNLLPSMQSQDLTLSLLKVFSEESLSPEIIVDHVLNQPQAKDWNLARKELVNQLNSSKLLRDFAEKILSKPGFGDESLAFTVVRKLGDRARLYERLRSEDAFDHDYLTDPELAPIYHAQTKAKIVGKALTQTVFNQPHAQNWGRAMLSLIALDEGQAATLGKRLVELQKHSDILSGFVRENSEVADWELLRVFRHVPGLYEDPRWLEEWMKRPRLDGILFRELVFSRPIPKLLENPEWMRSIVAKGSDELKTGIIHKVLLDVPWKNSPSVIEELVRRYPNSLEVIPFIIGRKDLVQHPEWLEPIVRAAEERRSPAIDRELLKLLSKPEWRGHPDWLQALVKRGQLDSGTFRELLRAPHWRNHAELQKMCGGKTPSLKCLQHGGPAPSFSACVLNSLKSFFSR
jgi:hypothetical protein